MPADVARAFVEDGFALPEGVRVLPDWLRDAGYFTANVVELPPACGFKGTGKTDWNFAYMGKPFEPMPQLLAIAEYITKTLAICMVCGNPANHTQRLVVSSDRLLLGAQGTYEARCRRCFDPALSSSGEGQA